MSFLDSLFGVNHLYWDSTEQITRKTWELFGSGVTVADNPTTGRTEITVTGADYTITLHGAAATAAFGVNVCELLPYTLTLPVIGAGDVGKVIIVKIDNTGTLTIDANTNGNIIDGSSADRIMSAANGALQMVVAAAGILVVVGEY